MKTTALLAAGVLALAVAAFPMPTSSASAMTTTMSQNMRDVIRLRGIITAVNRESIVLMLRSGREVEIGIVDRTRIFLNGERVRLSDLQPRDRAKVIAVRTRRGLIARAIRARRGDGG